MIYNIGLMLILIPGVIMDIQRKELPVVWLTVMAAAGLAVRFIRQDQPWLVLMTSVLAVLCCLATAFLSRGLGWGDAFLVGASGILSGPADLIPSLLVSTLAAALFGGARILMKKATFKTRLPFAPFLLVGYTVTKILDMAGRSI